MFELRLPFGHLYTYYSISLRLNLRTPGSLNSDPYIFLCFARSLAAVNPAMTSASTEPACDHKEPLPVDPTAQTEANSLIAPLCYQASHLAPMKHMVLLSNKSTIVKKTSIAKLAAAAQPRHDPDKTPQCIATMRIHPAHDSKNLRAQIEWVQLPKQVMSDSKQRFEHSKDSVSTTTSLGLIMKCSWNLVRSKTGGNRLSCKWPFIRMTSFR